MAGETWIINKTPNLINLTQDVTFTSYWSALGVDGHQFSKITIQSTKIVYTDSNNNSDNVYNSSSGWAVKFGSEEPQRTITFNSSPTGDLLVWLQANAAKQGPTISFKPRYKNDSLVGTGTYKFRHYSIAEPPKTETWIINETFEKDSNSFQIEVPFTSGGIQFGQISGGGSSDEYYGLIYIYLRSDGIWQTFFPLQNGWTVDKYRTIIFDKPVTDSTLLSWLQKNAVKQ